MKHYLCCADSIWQNLALNIRCLILLVGLTAGCHGQVATPANSPEKTEQLPDALLEKTQPNLLLSPELIPDSVKRRMLPPGHFKVDVAKVRQQDIFDHYINIMRKEHTTVEVFNGRNLLKLEFSLGEIIAASPDERYFSVAKLIRKHGAQYAAEYEIELRDLQNKIIARKRVAALGSEESEDEIFPLNNGQGIVQKAFFTNNNLYFKVFGIQRGSFLERFTYNKSRAWNSRFAVSDDNKNIVVGYTEKDSVSHAEKTYVESVDLKGRMLWKTYLPDAYMKGAIHISPFDGKVTFASKLKSHMEYKFLHIMDNQGKIQKVFRVYKGGLYNCSYQMTNSKQYLLAPSDGPYFYVIDLDKLEVINKSTMINPKYHIKYIAIQDRNIIATYFQTITLKDGSKGIDSGIIIENDQNNFAIQPLPSVCP